MDNFEKIYMQSIQLANKNGGLNEGLASNIVKAGLKVAAKTGKKIAEKTGKNIAKKTGSKTAGKVGEKLISKTASKLTAAQAKELVKKVTNTMNKSKILKMLSKKHYVRTLIAADFLDEHTKDFKTAFELLTDWVKGNYKATPWSIIALLGAFIAYVLLPEEYGKAADESEELENIIIKTLSFCKSELDKYETWKLQHPQEASLLEKDDGIISEFGDSKEFLSRNLITESVISEENITNKTQMMSKYLLFESAETDEKKLEELKKIDENTAEQIVNALKNNGATKLNLNEKGSQFLSQGQKQNIESFKGKKKPDQEAAKKILEQESWFMSTMKEIFSKETLISLIPFSQKPTLDDLGQFFLCMKDYISGNYDLSEPEFDALLGIGCDLGFSALSLALGGAAAFATFGLSTILAVIGCAATLGYICDNMAIIGRIYKKRKAENKMKLENNGEGVVVA